MKQEEFEEKLSDKGFGVGIVQKVYHTCDDDDNVTAIDEEGMREEFEERLQEVKDILNEADLKEGKLD